MVGNTEESEAVRSSEENKKFNYDQIQAAIDHCVDQINKTFDITVDGKHTFETYISLSLLNKLNRLNNLILKVECEYDSKKNRFDVYIQIKNTPDENGYEAERKFFATNGSEKQITVESMLKVHQMYESQGIGSALLFQSEKIRSTIFRHLSKQFGFSSTRSIIRDGSEPPRWTTNMVAQMPEYTYVGFENGLRTYERVDILTDNPSMHSLRNGRD